MAGKPARVRWHLRLLTLSTSETSLQPMAPAKWIVVSDQWLAGPPPCRADHTRVKQRTFMAYREQGPCRVKPVFYLLNMDAQDAQDKQHETLRLW